MDFTMGNYDDEIISILLRWIAIKQAGRDLGEYFVRHNYSAIAIYGWGNIGKLLFNELKNNNAVKVTAIIDRNADYLNIDLGNYDVDVISPVETFPPFDAVIVTTIRSYHEVITQMRNRTDKPIILIKDVLEES